MMGESATKRFCRRPTTLICGSARKRICDLAPKVVGEKNLGNAEAAKQKQFVGFMTMDSKVCSMKLLPRKEDDLVDVSIKEVGHVQFRLGAGSFFIDEEQNIAVVFDVDGYAPTKTGHPHHTAFIMGDDGYFKYVSLGEAPNVGVEADRVGYVPPMYCPPLVCSSSYLPSLVHF